MEVAVAVPTGAVAGVLSSLAGIGGGLVIIPCLKAFTTMSQHSINGTALLAGTMSCAAGAGSYILQGTAIVPVAALLVTFSVMTTRLGSNFAHSLPSHILSRVMGVFVMGMAPVVVWCGGKKQAASTAVGAGDEPENQPAAQPVPSSPLLGPLPAGTPELLRSTPGIAEAWAAAHIIVPIGLVTGFASGAFGIGGGVVMTAALGTACGMTQHEAVATSLCAIVPTGLAGTYHNMARGAVDVRAAVAIGLASMVATTATASLVTASIPDQELRYVLATVMVASGADMIRSSFVKQALTRLPK